MTNNNDNLKNLNQFETIILKKIFFTKIIKI